MAEWQGWRDNAMRTRPRSGPHSVDDVVSHLGKTRMAVTAGANRLAATATFDLATKPDVRTGESQIGTQQRDLDVIVYLAEGPHGRIGSQAIESRHSILAGAVRSSTI